MVKFLIQLEVEIEGFWKGVIRYDTAHGYAHIDRFNIEGNKKKERLDLNFKGSSPWRVGNFGMILDLRKHAGENLETQVLLIA